MPPEIPKVVAPDVAGPARSRGSRLLVERVRGLTAKARASRLKVGLLALTGGLLLLALAVAGWLLLPASPGSTGASLAEAMDALDAGLYEEARQMAEALRAGGVSPEEALGAPSFVLGAASAYEAEDAWTSNKRHLNLVASRYLEEARDLGFPADRKGEGLFLLGRSLCLSGQAAASRPVLRQALEAHPIEKTEIHRLLALAYLEDANPKYIEALEHNTVYLADHTLPRDAGHQGLLQRAEILLQLGKTAQCLETLDKIPATAAIRVEAIVIRGRVLMHEARSLSNVSEATEENESKAAEKYHAAIETLRRAQGHDTLAAQATRKSMYLIGVCFLELGDDRAALDQFARTRDRYIRTPEALAADVEIAELLQSLGQDEKALAAYRRALEAVGDTRQYSNPWIPLDQLRARALGAYEHYRDAEDFPRCLEVTGLLNRLFSRARTVELAAETRQLWGRSLLERAADLPRNASEPLMLQGRTQMRLAGRAFEQLAKLRLMTSHYPDDLWDSAECYLEGHGYQNAVDVLQEFLMTRSRLRHPRALVNLGEALLVLGKIDEALAAFEECIALDPDDAASFRARLAASQAHREKGNLEEAQSLLEENLSGGKITPESNEWRDSLFGLGNTLYVAGEYEKVTQRLEEAIARYPDSPQTVGARYLIADAYRRRAKLVEKESDEELIETARQARAQEISGFLSAALEQYRGVQETLTLRERQPGTELTPMEKSLLRNCYFSIGSVLFDLEQYDAAISTYGLVTNRYQNVPGVLEAYLQIARAYDRLNKPDDAREVVAQARVVLDRLRSAGDFQWTTIHAADEWPDVLDSLAATVPAAEGTQ
ncbi:MAG: tetratricopeptide repeat protein [Planctomycetota bacterium]